MVIVIIVTITVLFWLSISSSGGSPTFLAYNSCRKSGEGVPAELEE